MSIARNAGEEFLEEILYGSAYAYVFPQVREWLDSEFPDSVVNGKTQPNIMKEAVESAINVIMMGVLFMIIRYQEAFLDRLFALSRSATVAMLGGGKRFMNAAKNKIKSLRGVNAINRYNRFGESMNARVGLANHIQAQTDSIIKARDSQYNSVSIYSPGAQTVDTSVQKERLYQELGASKANAKIQLSMFKLHSATFSEADKQTLKAIFKSVNPNVAYDPTKVNIEDLNKIAHWMFTVDKDGKIIGLTEAMLHLLNGLGYIYKSNSGGN